MSRRRVNRASAKLVDGFLVDVSDGSRAPSSAPARHAVEHIQDLSYGPHPHGNRLDIYRPMKAENPLPVVLYIHGGGFRSLSKESHWIKGLIFARQLFGGQHQLSLGPGTPLPSSH